MTEIRVCSTDEVRDGSALAVNVAGTRVCVAHVGAEWFAIGDVCSHADFALSDGEVWADDCEIECPKHGSLFSLRTGLPQTLPATTPVPVFSIRIDGNDVMVDA